MNDLTKEELENILTCVNAVSYNNKQSAETLKSSKEKLKSMIDNYCEHLESKENHNPSVMECKKCGDFFVE